MRLFYVLTVAYATHIVLLFSVTIGDRIKAERKLKDWTIRDLSIRSGVSAPFISQVENARRGLTAERLMLLAKALGVSAGKLMGE